MILLAYLRCLLVTYVPAWCMIDIRCLLAMYVPACMIYFTGHVCSGLYDILYWPCMFRLVWYTLLAMYVPACMIYFTAHVCPCFYDILYWPCMFRLEWYTLLAMYVPACCMTDILRSEVFHVNFSWVFNTKILNFPTCTCLKDKKKAIIIFKDFSCML